MSVVHVVLMRNVYLNNKLDKNKNEKKFLQFLSKQQGKTSHLPIPNSEQNQCFTFSYASKADLYELTMHLARHFWNTCRSSIKRKLERSLLLDPLNELIHHINTVAPKSIIASRNEKETV